MSAFSKILVAALAAGAVHALPAASAMKATSTSSPFGSVNTAPGSTAPTASANPDLTARLREAGSALDREKILFTNEADGTLLSQSDLAKAVIFNFNDPNNFVGNANGGGNLSASNLDNFPVLTDLGVSVTVGFMDACSINTPHVHPRATEMLTLVDGTQLQFGMIPENGLVKSGSSEITGTLGKFQATVFPMGSIHYQVNPTCQPATFVAALSSDDPGVSQIAQNFFGLNDQVVNATLGFPNTIDGKNIEQFRDQIPANLARGVDTCLKACNIPT